MTKIRIYTVRPGDLAPCIEKNLKDVLVWLEEAELGETIKITIGEMEESEYEILPEYMGP